MTTPEAGFTYTIGGREMAFKFPNSAQLVLLQRFRMQITGAQDSEHLADLVLSVSMKTLNVVDSLFLDEADRQYTEDLLIAGKVDLAELMGILGGGKTTQDVPDDADPAPKKKTAVKRSPKAAKRG